MFEFCADFKTVLVFLQALIFFFFNFIKNKMPKISQFSQIMAKFGTFSCMKNQGSLIQFYI